MPFKLGRREYERQLKIRNPEFHERQKANCREWHRKNKERVREYQRKRLTDPRLKERDRQTKRKFTLKKYGLTQATYDALITEQNFLCKICDRRFDSMDVDHNHDTGKVRGLLCRACNTLLGQVEKRREHINKAIVYLEKCNG